jgi:NADH-quinone oxidoreductase subunit M
MVGVFVALDLFLFYVFWDAMLIPMYFLIGVWGYDRRIYAAIKFILYTMAGSVLMLIAILSLAVLHYQQFGAYSFSLGKLLQLTIAPASQALLFGAFTLAFAIKVPLFPLHTWLPDAHVEAPTAGSVILAGVLLKMGTYGLVRFAFPLFPEAAQQWAPLIAWLAVIGIVYGALVAMVQPDMKKLVAYSSVSHLGFVVLGICAMNVNGVQGAVYQMLAHGVSTGGLFLLVGMLSDRRHTRLIAEFGGLKQVMPMFVRVFFLVTLASIALPLTNGFVGEFLILLGTYRWDWRFAAIAASGVILSAVYMLWMFQRVNYGPVTNPKNEHLPDLTPREWTTILPIAAMAVFMGVLPNIFLAPMEPAVKRMVQRMERGHAPTAQVEGLTGAAPAPTDTSGTPKAGLQTRVE